MSSDTLNDFAIKEQFIKNNLKVDFVLGQFCSTQTYAKKLLPKNDTVLISPNQSQGIGRKGRNFLSNEGGCYFSIVERRENNVLRTTSRILVSVIEVLQEYGYCGKIKWPNDVLIKDKKICGIMCDVVKDRIILGVGLNLYNDISNISDIATSMFIEGDCKATRAELIARIVKRYFDMKKRDFSYVANQYQIHLNIMGKVVSINQNSKIFKGRVKRVTDEGFLILETEKGDKTIMSGEIQKEKA